MQLRNQDVDLDELQPHPKNYNRHPPEQVRRLAKSLSKFGQVRSVVVWRKTLLAGHGVVEAARILNWRTVRADVLPDDYPEHLALAYIAADNELAKQGDPDMAQLAAILEESKAADADLLEAIGYSDKEFEALLADVDKGAVGTGDAEPQTDRAEELRELWGVELGQLWGLAEHRLICGDCTDPATVARVMGGERAAAVVTDPPYGVGVDYDGFDDTSENVRTLIGKFMPLILEMAPIALTPGIPAMWDYPRPAWVGAWVHPASTSSGPWGFIGTNPILYYGDDPNLSDGEANPILFYGKDPYLRMGKGRRDSSLVLAASRKGESEHPVTKPLKVWSWLIKRMTPISGAIVFDGFLGSGTTLIACQNLSRRCRACEISPAYVAVTLQRFQDAFGITPVLVEG